MFYTVNFTLADGEKAYLKNDLGTIELVESRGIENDWGEEMCHMYDIYVAYVKDVEDIVWIDSFCDHWTPDLYEVCEHNVVFIQTWKKAVV